MRWRGRRAQRDDAAQAHAAAEQQRERALRTGEILRQARLARGQTLFDAERDTRINRLYLEAIEAAHFDVLPAPVYARGFMRAYARYLGLDAEEAARAVPHDLPRPAGLEPLPGLRRAAAVTLPAINGPLAIAMVAAVLLLVAALLIVPRLGGGAPAGAPAATATGTPQGAPAPVAGEAPDVVGISREAATAVLDRAGLTPLIFESANAAPAGQVYRQSPAAGSPVKRGDLITLFVSQGTGGTPTATPTAAASPTAR